MPLNQIIQVVLKRLILAKICCCLLRPTNTRSNTIALFRTQLTQCAVIFPQGNKLNRRKPRYISAVVPINVNVIVVVVRSVISDIAGRID